MELKGQVLNGYRIVEEVGSGGFGTVYLAEDERLDRRVALKVADAVDEETFRRFRTEAKALASLSHPRIVGLINLQSLPDGRIFLVLEWVDGKALGEVLKKGPLDFRKALEVVAAIAEALVAAHARGFIHRDLKPSNVLIPMSAGNLAFREAKLTDFSAVGKLVTMQHGTRTGQMFGTAYYMSPEQLRASSQTAASDFYGIGVLFYEMLYGRVPFAGDASYFDFVKRVMSEKVVLPDLPVIPRAAKALLLSCLEKDPDKRPASASAILNEINALTAGGPPRALESAPAPAGAVRARASGMSILAAVLVLVVVAALLVVRSRIESAQFAGIIAGLLLIALGVTVGPMIRRSIRRNRPPLEWDAEKLLKQAKTRPDIDKALTDEVSDLIMKCRSSDQRVLGLTMAQMVKEYENARESGNRQAALMNVVQLLEKLMTKLSPWYVRDEKLIAFIVTALGIISGVASIVTSIVKIIAPAK